MRAVIFLGAPDVDTGYLKNFIKADDYVICADSGYGYAKELGVSINAVLGDFDSYDINKVEFDEISVYPSEKDFTDCEIAVDFAMDKGADQVVLVCAKGGRSDHFLANIYALLRCAERGVFSYIFSENEKIYVAEGFFETTGKVGDILSVIPFAKAKNFTTRNLKYALENQDLPYTGVSNVFTDCDVSIEFEGRAIVVVVSS